MKIKPFFLIFSIVSVATSAVILFPSKQTLAKSSCRENVCSDTDSDCVEKLVSDCKAQLDKTKSKVATLASEIEYADNQIYISELRIQYTLQKLSEKNASITKLAGNIEDLITKIDKLGKSVEFQKNVLNERMRARYKSLESSPIIILLGSDTLNKLVQKTEYLRIMELQDHKLITQMNDTKKAYDQQKTLYEETREKEESLKQQIVAEKANLESYQTQLEDQRIQKQKLLDDTQNDEAKYQTLLEKANAQLAEFRGFTSVAGGGAISSGGFGKGKEGWYYSQRDARWAYKTIGYSSDTILDVGCLVTSVAMVFKSHGKDVDPYDIAKRDYYWGYTAYMTVPTSDFSSYWGNYSTLKSRIDTALNNGNPVIVGLKTGPYGTHFIVLAEKKDGNYIMYDPWYGPDLKLTSYYNTGEIYEAIFY